MLGDILFGGPSSRLYQKLVKDKGVVLRVAGGSDMRRGPSLFQGVASLKPGQDPGEVEKLIYEEFDRIKSGGGTPPEIGKNRMQGRGHPPEAAIRKLTP